MGRLLLLYYSAEHHMCAGSNKNPTHRRTGGRVGARKWEREGPLARAFSDGDARPARNLKFETHKHVHMITYGLGTITAGLYDSGDSVRYS